MNKPLRGVVACHGKLAEALIDATERISGVTGVLVPVTNTDCDRGLIERSKVRENVPIVMVTERGAEFRRGHRSGR